MLMRDGSGRQHQAVSSPSEPKLEDLGDRVWFALHCQPRDEHDRPPKAATFEDPHGPLARGTFGKIVSGQRRQVKDPTLVKLAKAMQVPVAFLVAGDKPWPKPTGAIPQRPKLYGADKKALSVGSTIPATGVVLDRLGIEHDDADYISLPGEHDLKRLPPEGRDAAMATVYLEGCTVQQATEAAVAALAKYGADAFGMGPEGWMKPIREILADWGVKRSRSSVRRIAAAPPPSKPSKNA